MALEPYSTEAGPIITSIRSIISRGTPAPRSKYAVPFHGSFRARPLSMSRTWLPKSLLMATPRAPISTPCMLGSVFIPMERKSMASSSVRMPCSRSSWAVMDTVVAGATLASLAEPEAVETRGSCSRVSSSSVPSAPAEVTTVDRRPATTDWHHGFIGSPLRVVGTRDGSRHVGPWLGVGSQRAGRGRTRHRTRRRIRVPHLRLWGPWTGRSGL